MRAYEKEVDERDYEEELNAIYGTVEVCGMTMDAGTVLRECDPTAFRCGMADKPIIWVCDECDTEYEDEDEANECCKEMFECELCGTEYDTEQEAIDCQKDCDID